MNILMMTNTYLPYVGGVERSVETFTREYRARGHRVIIVAPRFDDMPLHEEDVIRVPALPKFNGTDFSLQLPVPGILNGALKTLKPDIVHSHHPFMLGDSALRVSAQFKVPIVFTFHTYYERYTHYVPGDSPALKRFVMALATGYANLCDYVFAPSRSVAQELRIRGVNTATEVVPTGIALGAFARGDRDGFRARFGIPSGAFLVGFVSRLAPEKNLEFMAGAVRKFLERNAGAHFLVVGTGPSEQGFSSQFSHPDIVGRFHAVGRLTGQDLVDSYHAMDVFAFASQTETQGLVLTEALASAIPVVALNGPGVAEVVADRVNGRLILRSEEVEFAAALEWVAGLPEHRCRRMKLNARRTAEPFSKERCAARALAIYEDLALRRYVVRARSDSAWERAKRLVKAEMDLLVNMTKATGAAMNDAARLPGL